MSVHRIGELLPQILARAATMAEFQKALNALPNDKHRKNAIITAKFAEEISDEDCHLLIEAYGLEGI